MTRLDCIALLCLVSLTAPARVSAVEAAIELSDHERVWIGPEWWANPLQDWRLQNGRIENVVSGGNRSVFLLTHSLGDAPSGFEVRVRLGKLRADSRSPGWAGVRLGIRAYVDDYRAAAIRGRGFNVGVTASGKPFVGDEQAFAAQRRRDAGVPLDDVELRVTAEPSGGGYTLTAALHDPESGRRLGRSATGSVDAAVLVGGVSLVSEHTPDLQPTDQNSYGAGGRRGGDVGFWFQDLRLSGDKVVANPERAWGPILWAQHTLSRGVMKMTVQLPPLGVEDAPAIRLQVRDNKGDWENVDEEPIHTLARTATFRIEDWQSFQDIPYRIAYDFEGEERYWEGKVRRDPVEKRELTVAAFTGNKDTGFPNLEVARNVAEDDPDVLFFSGDQIYEDVAGFGIERLPVETAALDYLRKWWLLGWAFGDLMRDRVTVHMPDDHDVYQGNIWGGGGRKIPLAEHERGGYAMPAEWVNAVQRTQSSHLPDPYDATPAEQGISVYYSELLYGRVSFAILEDRKFKSGPKGITPPTGGRPDHITDPNFDPRAYDVPGAKLLGDRQLAFIRDWAADWTGADFKASLTQSIFANAATTHGAEMMRLVADLDSNGWPQAGRNRALHELRKGLAFMIGGDQHLPSIIHHGIEKFSDAGYSFCVPSIAAGYPRSYEPETPARNRPPGAPDYAGERLDGLGNHMTIYAVANPVPPERQRTQPVEKLHDKSSGYGLIRFDKETRKITMECWKLLTEEQFEGWPLTIDQADNDGRTPAGWLPTLEVDGIENPVVQVIDEVSGEIVYTLRIRGQSYRPKVYRDWSTYTVRVGEPDRNLWRTFEGLGADQVQRELKVSF